MHTRSLALLYLIVVLAVDAAINHGDTDRNMFPTQPDFSTSESTGGGLERVEIPLRNIHNTRYVASISVGTPPQPIDVVLDTSSSIVWIASTDCWSSGCQITQKRLNTTASSSYASLGTSISVKFGTGFISGTLGVETVGFGEAQIDHLGFGKILVEEGPVFGSGTQGGILGLGFGETSDVHTQTLLDSIQRRHVLQLSAVSFYLTRFPDTHSMVVFGNPDKSLYVPPLTFMSLFRPYHWELSLDAVLIGDKAVGGCGTHHTCKVLVDTCTSLATAPSDAYIELHRLIAIRSDCTNVDALPTISFVMSGNIYSLEPADYVVHLGDACRVGFMSLDVSDSSGVSAWILGGLFMRKFYTVFDRTNGQIGFALARAPS